MDLPAQPVNPAAAPVASHVGVMELVDRLSMVGKEIHDLYETVPFGSHALDERGTYLQINALELAWLGYSRGEVVGKRKLTEFLTPASQELLLQKQFLSGMHSAVTDLGLELIRRDGTCMPIMLSSVPYVDNFGKLLKQRALVFDMRASQKNKIRDLIADTTFDSLSGMFITDERTVISRVNRAFTKLTGYSEQEAVGQTPRLLRSGLHDAAFYEAMWASVNETGTWQGEITNRRKDGALIIEWLSISAVSHAGGAVSHYVGSFFDITSNKKADADLLQLAYFDPLTNLPNRRLLLDRMGQAIASAKRNGLFGAVLFVDLDYFKAINDTHGHEAGDLVLAEAARRLRDAVRAEDSVARLGGDEFVVMLEGLNEQALEAASEAEIVANKILMALAQPYQFSGFEFHCTASIGLELFTDTVSAPILLQHADLAMYQSKLGGRNRLRFFSPGMQEKVTARGVMEVELRHALELGQFQLFFQPQVNLKGEIVAAEALLRWNHPRLGLVFPGDFIALAEETELIVHIGQWVLETACAQLKAWESMSFSSHLRLAVNVSARQFRHEQFAARMEQTLAASNIRPARLVLEITESMILDVPDAIEKMNVLKKLGVSFSMDDFGTGYSSLASLTQLPLSELKIDQSFVRNLGVSRNDAIIVQATIALGQALGLEIVAEGVETAEQLDFLKRYGCQQFQGYLFSRPVPIEQFETLLQEGVTRALRNPTVKSPT